MAYGHGAEPAADKVHGRDADADGADGRRLDLREQVRGQVRHGDDGVQRRQRQLAHARVEDAGLPLLGVWPLHVRPPEAEMREMVVTARASISVDLNHGEDEPDDEHDQRVRRARTEMECKERQERQHHPEIVVQRRRSPPPERCEGVRARGENQTQSRADLDALHDGDGDDARKPRQQPGDTEQQNAAGDEQPCGGGLARAEGLEDGHGGDGLHGLHGQGDAENRAGQDVVDTREDERRGQRDLVALGQRDHDGQERAQVAQRAGDLVPRLACEGAVVVGADLAQAGGGVVRHCRS